MNDARVVERESSAALATRWGHWLFAGPRLGEWVVAIDASRVDTQSCFAGEEIAAALEREGASTGSRWAWQRHSGDPRSETVLIGCVE